MLAELKGCNGEELLEGTRLSCAPSLVRKSSGSVFCAWVENPDEQAWRGLAVGVACAFFPEEDDFSASIQGNRGT